MQLQNFDGPGVAFTAYTDDSLKGDTNGDGASFRTAGYCEGICTTGIFWFNWGNIYFAAPHKKNIFNGIRDCFAIPDVTRAHTCLERSRREGLKKHLFV